MPIALVCGCGAKLEVDDTFAGRGITCPDCSSPLQVPRRAPTGPRPSWASLASACLLLFGAFSVAASLAAAGLAAFTLWQLRQQRGKLGGGKLALGVLITGVTLAVMTSAVWGSTRWLPLARWLREQSLAGQVDAGGPLEAQCSDGGSSLTRPSRDWARATRGQVGDPAVGDLQKGRLLVLAYLPEKAYADLGRFDGEGHLTFEQLNALIEKQLLPEEAEPAEGLRAWIRNPSRLRPTTTTASSRRLDDVQGWRAWEWVIELRRGGLNWKFLIRAYRKPRSAKGDPVYVARAYAPTRSFPALEAELARVLDSVHLLK
jgi:DNA-directed RNA polymerase subunit RPC12/RpoP